MESYVAEVWLALIGLLLLAYAVADGAGMGVGIISLLCRRDGEKDVLAATISGVWHDNQTWLVLVGGTLLGAFPLVFNVVLSALYVPIVAMLFGLIFRGVSLEFRGNSTNRRLWDMAFGLGSLLMALSQGFALGGLLGGIPVSQGKFSGSMFGWFTPYSIVVSAGVVCGYVMLGAGFIVLKTEGAIQEKGFRLAWTASVITLLISFAVHVWNLLLHPVLFEKLAAFPGGLLMIVLTGLAGICFILYFRSVRLKKEKAPFLWNSAIVFFSFAGLSIGFYPNMIPNLISPVTVSAAAGLDATLLFMVSVVLIMLPSILVYTFYKQRVFGGKVDGAAADYPE